MKPLTRCEPNIDNTQLFPPKAIRLEIWFGLSREAENMKEISTNWQETRQGQAGGGSQLMCSGLRVILCMWKLFAIDWTADIMGWMRLMMLRSIRKLHTHLKVNTGILKKVMFVFGLLWDLDCVDIRKCKHRYRMYEVKSVHVILIWV